MAIECDHGIQKEDEMYKWFIEILTEFTHQEKELFLLFMSGSRRLLENNWSKMTPPLKIVLKPDGLPSVMTCAHYLKLRRYSTKEKLLDELKYSIQEGSEFHLS